jgi:hypothetical protein
VTGSRHLRPASTKDFGKASLKQNQYLAIRIPSVVVPEEYNYLINLMDTEMSKAHIVEVKIVFKICVLK